MVGSKLGLAIALLATLLSVKATAESDLLRVMGPQGINLWKLQKYSEARDQRTHFFIQDTSQLDAEYSTEFPAYYFDQPLDHFSNCTETFGQRYWVSTRHYTPGVSGPVFVLDGGETSGEDRLAFLDTG
jgi:hypothetical protein